MDWFGKSEVGSRKSEVLDLDPKRKPVPARSLLRAPSGALARHRSISSSRLHRSSILRRGFTLLELIVVITIIGILGTMVVVKVGGWAGKARITKIKSDLKSIVSAAEMYQVATGRYPQTLEELKSGKDQSGNDIGSSIETTKDPWNNEYLFELGSDGKPRARCLGQDGAEGGDGDNKDFDEPEAANQ